MVLLKCMFMQIKCVFIKGRKEGLENEKNRKSSQSCWFKCQFCNRASMTQQNNMSSFSSLLIGLQPFKVGEMDSSTLV